MKFLSQKEFLELDGNYHDNTPKTTAGVKVRNRVVAVKYGAQVNGVIGNANEIKNLQAQLTSLNVQIGELKGQIAVLEGVLAGKENDLTLAKDNIKSLEVQLTTATEDKEKLTAQLEELQQKCKELEDEIKSLNSEKETLTANITSLTTERDKYKTDLDAANAKIKELQQQLAELQEDNKTNAEMIARQEAYINGLDTALVENYYIHTVALRSAITNNYTIVLNIPSFSADEDHFNDKNVLNFLASVYGLNARIPCIGYLYAPYHTSGYITAISLGVYNAYYRLTNEPWNETTYTNDAGEIVKWKDAPTDYVIEKGRVAVCGVYFFNEELDYTKDTVTDIAEWDYANGYGRRSFDVECLTLTTCKLDGNDQIDLSKPLYYHDVEMYKNNYHPVGSLYWYGEMHAMFLSNKEDAYTSGSPLDDMAVQTFGKPSYIPWTWNTRDASSSGGTVNEYEKPFYRILQYYHYNSRQGSSLGFYGGYTFGNFTPPTDSTTKTKIEYSLLSGDNYTNYYPFEYKVRKDTIFKATLADWSKF